MSNPHYHLRSASTSTGMRVRVNPNPFVPGVGYTIYVTGGIPPYTYAPGPVPPNPPGVTVMPNGDSCLVNVPPGVPSAMNISVDVTDSSQPPQTQTATSKTA